MTQWFSRMVLIAVAAVSGSAQSVTPISFTLSGTGSGSGLPGRIDAHLSSGTMVLTNVVGNSTTIPLAFVGIDGDGTNTGIGIIPAGNSNDVINFSGTGASLSDLGRSGTIGVGFGTGGFHGVTGSITFTLTCTFICFNGNGTPTADIFKFTFSATGTLNINTSIGQYLLPSIIPKPPPGTASQPPAPGVIDTVVSIYTFITNPSGSISHLRTQASSSGGNSSFNVAVPWQPDQTTYNAAATCPGSPSSCWMSLESSTGTIAPFTDSSIPVDINPGALATGVYPANFALTLTPSAGSGSPSTENIPFTLLVTNGAPLLQVSESEILFQTVTGGQNLPVHTITLSSTGAAIPYSATASTLSGGNWLSIQQGSGSASSSSTGIFYISTTTSGLAAGTYFGRVDISAPTAFKPLQSVLVELTVTAAPSTSLNLSTTGLIFVAPQGSNPAAQQVNVTTLSTTPIAVTGKAGTDTTTTWIAGTASAAMLQAGQPIIETVSIDTKGLTPGVYTGTLYEEIAATITDYPVAVTLVVTPPSGSACTPTQLLPVITSVQQGFELPAGLPASVRASIVDDCGSPLKTGAVLASLSNGDPSFPMVPVGNGQWSGTWNPHGLTGGGTSFTVIAQSPDGFQGSTSVAGTLDPNTTATVITPGGIVNAASLVSSVPVAPGEFLSIFGSNLASATTSSASFPYSTSLGGTRVLLGGQPMPLEFVSPGQINALVPYGTMLNSLQDLIVQQNGVYSFAETVVIATANPAVFTQDQSGQGPGVIVAIRPDGTQFETSATQPAAAGDVLVIYCSGLGPVNPPVADGAPASLSTLSNTVNPVTVTVGGQSANVLFAGLAPGFAGLYQVNALVPAGITAGPSVPVLLTTSGFASAPVTVAIQ